MIEIVIDQRRRDIGGGFEVGRVLPFAKRRMGVALARADEIGTARERAKLAASRVKPRAA